MKRTMTGAWIVGAAVLITAHILWFASLQAHQFSEIKMVILWGSPFIAAFVSAYLSPRKKVVIGISMALLSAILVILTNYIYQQLGNAVDFSGIKGASILFVNTLFYSCILCALGAFGGRYLSGRVSGINQVG